MKWGQFKDPVFHISLPGAQVAPWYLTQEVTGLNHFNGMRTILVTEFSHFNKSI